MRGSKKGKIWINLGLLLIAAALFLTAYNFYAARKAGQSSLEAVKALDEIIPDNSSNGMKDIWEDGFPDYVLNPDKEMPVEIVDGREYIGIVEILDLGLKLPVISRWSYSDLQQAPCRYSGSVYKNNMVIAAHNYRSHFGSLSKLSEGSEVIFTDIDGNIFYYEVAVLETLRADASEEMEDSEWDLSLFTCNMSGNYRVTVRCERIYD